MKRIQLLHRNILTLACVAISVSLFASDNDWPQWRGPNRDGVSPETGLIKSWPAGGPDVLWRTQLGTGFSGISVGGDRLVTMFAEDRKSWVVCYDPADGSEIWRFQSDESPFQSQFGHGPRATPLIHDGMVYAVGGNAKLHALKLGDGTEVWSRDLRAEFGAKIPYHGVSSSPIVEGDLLIVNVGGKDGFAFMAFDKNDGEVVWSSHSDVPGYSTPITVTVDGIRQILFFAGTGLVSVSPETGDVYWQYPWETKFNINASTPVFIPEDKILISSSYGMGAALLEVTKTTVRTLWKSKVMRNRFTSSIYYKGYLYGFDETTLKCMDVFTQEEKWATRGYKRGSFIIADDQLIVLSEDGRLALVEATPAAFRQTAAVKLFTGRCWTVPTLANGVLYLRNQEEMIAVDMKR